MKPNQNGKHQSLHLKYSLIALSLSRINQNGNTRSSASTAQSLGDYISLSNDESSTQKKRSSSSPEEDIVLSSENDDDLLIE